MQTALGSGTGQKAFLPKLPATIVSSRKEDLADLFREAAQAGHPAVDGSTVHSLDSAGLEILVDLLTTSGRRGHPLAIASPSPTLCAAREALQLASFLPFHEDGKEAERTESTSRLGEILIELGFLKESQLEEAMQTASSKPDRQLGAVLVEDGYIKEDQLAQALAQQFRLPYVEPVACRIVDVALEHQVPFPILRANRSLPFLRWKDRLAVAVQDPSNVFSTDTIRDHSGLHIFLSVASEGEIEKGLDLLQRAVSARGEETGSSIERSGSSSEERLNEILLNALIEGASDIHIEPFENGHRVRYRVDGRLRRISSLNKEDGNSLTARIKVLAGCDISEKRLPQDGRHHFQENSRDVDLRVSTLPTVFGEKTVIRILDRKSSQVTLKQLGMAGQNLEWLQEGIRSSHGLVLVTGPTGSGKTTTLYSVLDEIVTPEVNVSTVENPVERGVEGVNQTQINHKAGLTFGRCLRALLRQDPDIIMIGEIRDTETAEIAMEAALTGHLVLATLHTNDAPGAASRLIQMNIEPFLVAATLRVVMAQRLVRSLCDLCKAPVTLPPEIREKYGPHGLGEGPHFRAVGCPSCRGLGYDRRLGIFEVMRVDEPMQDLISRNPSSYEIRSKALEGGMSTLLMDGIRLVEEGRTTLEEAIRAGGNA